MLKIMKYDDIHVHMRFITPNFLFNRNNDFESLDNYC